MNLRYDALRTDTDVLAAEPPYIDGEGGAPLRCCLRDSRVGEEIRLVLVAPPGPRDVYSETGPVFMHSPTALCSGPQEGYPAEWRARPQVFRAYSAEGRILGGRVVNPDENQESVAADLLADPDTEFLHSRNVVHGCYMFAIRCE